MPSTQQASIIPADYYSETLFSEHIVNIMKKGNILTTGTPARAPAKSVIV